MGVVLSSAFLQSRWCQDELEQALAQEKRSDKISIVPILRERVQPPPFVEGRLYCDFTDDYFGSLFRLSAQLHQYRPMEITYSLDSATPMDLADVSSMLEELGWDGEIPLWDDEFSQLKEALAESGNYIAGDVADIDEMLLLKISKRLPATLKHLVASWNIDDGTEPSTRT